MENAKVVAIEINSISNLFKLFIFIYRYLLYYPVCFKRYYARYDRQIPPSYMLGYEFSQFWTHLRSDIEGPLISR